MLFGFVILIAFESLSAPDHSLKITGCAASAGVMSTHQILVKIPKQEFQEYWFLIMTDSSLFHFASSSPTGCQNLYMAEYLLIREIFKESGSPKGNI